MKKKIDIQKHFPENFSSNFEFILQAVSENGDLLAYADELLRSDPIIVLASVLSRGLSNFILSLSNAKLSLSSFI